MGFRYFLAFLFIFFIYSHSVYANLSQFASNDSINSAASASAADSGDSSATKDPKDSKDSKETEAESKARLDRIWHRELFYIKAGGGGVWPCVFARGDAQCGGDFAGLLNLGFGYNWQFTPHGDFIVGIKIGFGSELGIQLLGADTETFFVPYLESQIYVGYGRVALYGSFSAEVLAHDSIQSFGYAFGGGFFGFIDSKNGFDIGIRYSMVLNSMKFIINYEYRF